MDRKLYPRNWPEIRAAVIERAHSSCEICRVTDGTLATSRHTGRRYILYLHAAHLGDSPRDRRLSNLRALCPSCHMRMDRQAEAQTRKTSRRRGYRLTTTDRLIKAMGVAGLQIQETERGYAWQVDDLAGHATSAINAVADAIYHLRQHQGDQS
ncbi:hypothetical protein [Ktedonospora formicarum]|uniref:HNH endonuclease n=1 Tax=Ktedonospora formicarum TaxID=2778364 RepID=A0A8J3MZ37_9CHLR|nr:hypothetical protein [Ktedonospora formicarum]GHO51418.1 hypothetical protein KSX_95810 [Ktedonospora formicarum]